MQCPIDDVIRAYEGQCGAIEKLGGRIVLMASRALVKAARGPEVTANERGIPPPAVIACAIAAATSRSLTPGRARANAAAIPCSSKPAADRMRAINHLGVSVSPNHPRAIDCPT